MTNREYLIAQLSDENFIDDDGASYESMLYYNIHCPYFYGDTRAFCYLQEWGSIDRDRCFKCKEKWLNSEVDK